ncbi:MAG TPA: DNA replication initiation control protein YabA [Pseudogracilibacillus sp.]|nr:DNA replication initiation control protein YabA [Pseudogracilibacillus sp.]
MDKRKVFEQVSDIESQIGELYEQLEELKDNLADLLEENYRMSMENKHLRSYLDEQEIKRVKVDEKENSNANLPGEGFDNLARIYEEGFHICHMQFGSPRQDGDCLFCLELFD